MREFERREKKDFQPFCKKAGEKLSAASRKAGGTANNRKQQQGFIALLFSFCTGLQKISRKTANVQQMSPHKTNAVIKLQTDETSHVSAGVKGAALAPFKKSLISKFLSFLFKISFISTRNMV